MSEVYSPAEDTFLLAEVLKSEHLSGKAVLEIGCGSGYLAKIIAERKAIVTAVDINPAAIEATKKILKDSRLNAYVFLSDLFDKVVGTFDLIIFNPPYLPENEEDEAVGSDIRYSGGKSGRNIIEKFIKQSREHLKSDGKMLMLVSSATGEKDVLLLLTKFGFSARAVARKKVEWEELMVLEITCS